MSQNDVSFLRTGPARGGRLISCVLCMSRWMQSLFFSFVPRTVFWWMSLACHRFLPHKQRIATNCTALQLETLLYVKFWPENTTSFAAGLGRVCYCHWRASMWPLGVYWTFYKLYFPFIPPSLLLLHSWCHPSAVLASNKTFFISLQSFFLVLCVVSPYWLTFMA